MPTNDSQHGLIINSAYSEPTRYWNYEGADSLSDGKLKECRRPAEYIKATPGKDGAYLVPERIKLEVIDAIRDRVKRWRIAGYEGTSPVTRQLLRHWYDNEVRVHPFFFCQLEAIETLIWLAEAPARDKKGLAIGDDGGDFKRLCTKLCTGGGKTAVMACLIAWQVANHASYPNDKKFTDHILVVSPNLTVKSRLATLVPGAPVIASGAKQSTDCYTEFAILPPNLAPLMASAHVEVINWQMLHYDDEEALAKRRSVDKKKGAMSDKAFTNKILPLWNDRIIVINDEAHHAWRYNENSNGRGKASRAPGTSAEYEEATVWINGLDRINRALGINCCYDFSATPFVPSGKGNRREALFTWIVSDFSLNDGIESGIVKTPRIVVRDDALKAAIGKKSRLFHIYAETDVKSSLSAAEKADKSLPPLVNNAYSLLAADYKETSDAWDEAHSPVPPVMISVCNRTETAARVEYAFLHHEIQAPDVLCDESATLHIDSKVLDAEGRDGDALREKADTVGQEGKAGAQYRHVVSVGMLSEGWDAKTVTHIMGLRAFSSQLLCEQVVGRGLRRTAYDVDENGMFEPEYVNIFGIPFMFLPHEDCDDERRIKPRKPVHRVYVKDNAEQYEITWPNVLRIDRIMGKRLAANIDKIPPLTLDAAAVILSADMASVIDGKTHITDLTTIDMERINHTYRLQYMLLTAASQTIRRMPVEWTSERSVTSLVGDIFAIADAFINKGKITIEPQLFAASEVARAVVLTVNCPKIVEHIWNSLELQSANSIAVMVNNTRSVCSTRDMPTWYTKLPVAIAQKSQINGCVCDSTWEDTAGYALDHNEHVTAWAKNDHLGFDIGYTFEGVRHRYRPDFLVKLDNGVTLVLETKGEEDEKAKAKKDALKEWIAAVNADGRWGRWASDTSYNVKDVNGICGKIACL